MRQFGLIGKRFRRFWSDDEKRLICRQTCAPGVSVSQVSRRYSVNANLIFKWLRDPRFASADSGNVGPDFLPIEIEAAPVNLASSVPQGDGRLEITLANGHRLSVSGHYDPDVLARLIRGLSK